MTSAARPPLATAPAATTPTSTRDRMAHLARTVGRWSRTTAGIDLAICLGYLVFAFWLTRGLWPHPATRAIADNVNDQALMEWFLAHGVRFWQGDLSLVTDLLNAPDGVNLMSNTSLILHGVIMAPVVAAFGAPVSFALLVAQNLAATAAGWYLLLARALRLRRSAAFVGGAFSGFAPGMISQSNSHLHMTAQWLVPLLVYGVIRLARATTRATAARTGVALGVVLFAQALLGEEVLFLTALTLALFCAVYALRRRAWAREVAARFLTGAAVAGVVAGVLLAYPLWMQFRGPQHTPNAPFGAEFFYADVLSYLAFSPLSVAGSAGAGRLATSPTEYNAYLGVPILLVVVAIVIWRRRSPVTVAIAVTAIVMTLLSFGPNVTVNGTRTGWPSLYAALGHIPVVNAALPTRYALALIPLIGVLVAGALDAAAASAGFARVAVPIVVAAALLPMAPLPLAATQRQPVPDFIASGAWRQCAPEGGVIAPVPLPTPQMPDLMRWPAAANDAFAIPEGFFIGPYGPQGRSSLGIYPRPTSLLLAEVSRTAVVPPIDDAARAQARADLDYWRADCVALADVANQDALHTTLDQLLGPGTSIDGTWTWKVSR